MRWIDRMKTGIRSWLDITEASPLRISILESLDYESNAIRNRIWYRGDSNEIQQLYENLGPGNVADRYKFWASRPTPGQEIRKIHTGLPSLIVDTLATVTVQGLKNISFSKDSSKYEEVWSHIEKENQFVKKLEKTIKETLYIGDGAYKIHYDNEISEFPMLEFIPGDRIEYTCKCGRVQEVIFKTEYNHLNRKYVLRETYGYGYITYELFHGNSKVDLNTVPELASLANMAFGGGTINEEGQITGKGDYMLAVPIRFYESSKWDERGQSIFDRKVDAFDAFDEAFSQWMDALRSGRTKEYIPESLVPRGEKGELLRSNPFDNRFIKIGDDMSEGGNNKITQETPVIQHESYQAAYITALDLCLQGIISPSTLGIDVKKLDNAEAQREKEKTTLYTRSSIIEALEGSLPQVIEALLKCYSETIGKSPEPVKVTVDFGEYANPSFEAKVETVGKGKQQGVMSTEAAVEELYGDSKDDKWKKEEVKRLKAEQGIEELDEPQISSGLGDFDLEVN